MLMSPRLSDIGPLEMEVFGLLDPKQPFSVTEVQEKLKKNGRPLAYTTVMTVLVRLHAKDLVSRHKMGRQFLYSQAGHATAVKQNTLMKLKASLFGRNRLKPILTLLEGEESLSDAELKELRDVVDQKIRKSRKKE
jgi:BlaI family transcriptional regulator, penicillinase repressor